MIDGSWNSSRECADAHVEREQQVGRSVGSPSARTAPCAISVKSAWQRTANTSISSPKARRQQSSMALSVSHGISVYAGAAGEKRSNKTASMLPSASLASKLLRAIMPLAPLALFV